MKTIFVEKNIKNFFFFFVNKNANYFLTKIFAKRDNSRFASVLLAI